MIYRGDDSALTSCKFCNHPRFKSKRGSEKRKKKVSFKRMYYFPLSPRLQLLYASEVTAIHMQWHSEHIQEDRTMCHPSDFEARKNFSPLHPSFASENHNVRLGLCTDDF